jgi:hypothetical protein
MKRWKRSGEEENGLRLGGSDEKQKRGKTPPWRLPKRSSDSKVGSHRVAFGHWPKGAKPVKFRKITRFYKSTLDIGWSSTYIVIQ